MSVFVFVFCVCVFIFSGLHFYCLYLLCISLCEWFVSHIGVLLSCQFASIYFAWISLARLYCCQSLGISLCIRKCGEFDIALPTGQHFFQVQGSASGSAPIVAQGRLDGSGIRCPLEPHQEP